jgi:hypothetical protein
MILLKEINPWGNCVLRHVMVGADCQRVHAGWWLLIDISTISSDTTPNWLAVSDRRVATRTCCHAYEILVS